MDLHFVLVCGQLAENLLNHKAWWIPLMDGNMVLQMILINL
jgi:hypothetical protein